MAKDRVMERETRMMCAMGVETNGTTRVQALLIPAGMEVSHVWVRVARVGTGAANLIIGDEDDDNGWVLASDHTAAVGTIYGDLTADLGVYAITQVATTPAVDEPVPPKKYAAEKNIFVELSASGTIQSKWDVFATMTPIPDSIT